MRIPLLLLIIIIPAMISAQVGGNHVFEFVNLPNSAHVAALGGKNITLWDNELSYSYYNPALLTSDMQSQFSLNYTNYFLDINYGYFAYSPVWNKKGNLAAGILYMNYGSFIAADYTGRITGKFKAAEYNPYITWSVPLDSLFTVGFNVKTVFSDLEQYFSMGIMTDAGIHYRSRDKLFSSGLVIRNLGMQVVKYTSGERESTPFEIQLGITQKLHHAPFRYTVLLQHLEQYNMAYQAPGRITSAYRIQTTTTSKTKQLIDNLARHLIIGLEFMPVKSFSGRISYNFQRKQELQITEFISTVGLSWGIGLNLSKFNIAYARSHYNLAGSTNHFSITVKLDQFTRR